MYDTRLADTELSLQSILEKTTEYDIYRYYLGSQFVIGKIMSSPFHADRHPSFGLFKSSKTGSILYKDLSTGNSGNCVHLVQKLYSLSYREALIRIITDIVSNNLSISCQGVHIREEFANTPTIISIKKKNFCKADDLYWGSFCLFRDDLRHFNVFPIQMYWINEIVQPWAYKWANPGYAYQVYNKYKIYKPLEDKNNKWVTNCNSYDIQGLEQLNDSKGDLLIITKSLKDVMVLYKLGYKSIAPNSENNGIPKKIIDNLKSRFTRIVILYDNDEAGINGGNKLKSKTNFETIFLPDTNTKDISDYVKLNGLEKGKEMIKQLL